MTTIRRNRHSPDCRPFRGQDRASDRLGQRQIAAAASKGPSTLVVDGGPPLKHAALLVPKHTSWCTWLALVMPGRVAPAGGRPATDFLEHLSRWFDLGHLGDHRASVADRFRVDLDQLLLQTGQRPRFRRLELKTDGIGGEGTSGDPLDRSRRNAALSRSLAARLLRSGWLANLRRPRDIQVQP